MIHSYINSKLTKSVLIGVKDCLSPVERSYARDEIITICSSDNDTIGIITKGTVYLSSTNAEDQRRILDYYNEGDVFGIHFPPENENKAFYIIAKTKCTISFIKYKKAITCCKNVCEKHQQLINCIIMQSIRKQIIHIDVLEQKNLRNKLLSFFEYIKSENNSSTFTLPLTLTDLADFLSVDRSAMMREIKNLNEEGIIKSDKRNITILTVSPTSKAADII